MLKVVTDADFGCLCPKHELVPHFINLDDK